MPDKSYQIAFDGTPASSDFYGDVVSVVVEEDVNKATHLSLVLATSQNDDGSWTHLDDDQLALFAHVTVSTGFSGGGGLADALGGAAAAVGGALGASPGGNAGLVPVFDGYITAIHLQLPSEPGATTLEVQGLDTSVLMSLEEKVRTFPDMSDSDIVQQIVSGYGVQVQADSTATVHQENDTTIVQRGTDIQFVRELAARNGVEFYFESDPSSGEVTAYFQAPQLDGTPQPDLAIQFADSSNLRHFSAYLSGQRPLSVKTQQTDVKAGTPNSAQVTDTELTKLGDKDANTLIGGPLNNLVTPQDTQAQMLLLAPPTSDATELQTVAQAVRDEAAWFITATGEVNNDAYQAVLRPHRVVLVKGAGKTYSGKYYVTRVTHELKADGSYVQRFEARRNARDLDGSEQFASSSLGIAIPGV
jgi:phage protein D